MPRPRSQNVRRRLEQEMQQATAYAAAGFARDMLAIKDHLERALAAVTRRAARRQDREPVPCRASRRPRASSKRRFTRNGVTRIKSVGENARPAPPPGDDRNPERRAEPGTIVEEMQAGYMMKDRLLRPALVGVAKKPD